MDALRAFAMALGIVLHGVLSFFPYPWPAQDLRQSPLFYLLFAVVHGFRMPLFFLLSGFFTWRILQRRGAWGLARERARRILLPLCVAAACLLPLDRLCTDFALRRTAEARTRGQSPLTRALLGNDSAGVDRALRDGASLAENDTRLGLLPLAIAAAVGDPERVSQLMDAGADVRAHSQDGNTALHVAAFFGRDRVVTLLLARGADPRAVNRSGSTPRESGSSSPDFALGLAQFLGMQITAETLDAGRDRADAALRAAETGGMADGRATRSALERWVLGYERFFKSDQFIVEAGGYRIPLLDPVGLDHLWFLWYLLVLGVLFLGVIRLGIVPTSGQIPVLVLATWGGQFFMSSHFGPELGGTLLPTPHSLIYYGAFFWAGAVFAVRSGTGGPTIPRWGVLILVGLVLLMPAGLVSARHRLLTTALQAAYAWVVSLGLIGLFRRHGHHHPARTRWLAEASYWMYLAHLPLVLCLQAVVVGWEVPSGLKFLGVVGLALALLLVSYRWVIRPGPIGWLLNGRRDASTSVR
jgi:peptidoglycan/LPS O-acetylase OafA/YrhL